jgi:hypothetical protein
LRFPLTGQAVSKEANSIELYAQEPAFNTLDTTFLAALGIRVLPTGAQHHISSTTFLFAPFVDWNLMLPTFLKDRDPELYIGNEILADYSRFAQAEEKRRVLAECNRMGEGFLRGRERVRLAGFELHEHALEGLVLYWKEEDCDGEE